MAIRLAWESIQRPEGRPFGAIVTIDGEIVGRGTNQTVSLSDPTAHAEVMAIRSACAAKQTHRLERGTLVTSCEPCPLCLAAAMWAGINEIYFACSTDDSAKLGFSDREFYRQIALPREQRAIPSHQILGEEGRAVVQEFYRLRLADKVRGYVSD